MMDFFNILKSISFPEIPMLNLCSGVLYAGIIGSSFSLFKTFQE